MTADRRKTGAFAARIVRITLIVVFITVFAAMAMSFASVAKMASSDAKSRQVMAIHAITQRVQSRFSTVSLAVRRTIAGLAAADMSSDSAMRLAFESTAPYFDEVIIARRDGEVLFSQVVRRPGSEPGVIEGVLDAARGGATGPLSLVSESGSWRLWFVESGVDAQGSPFYVVARMNTGFLDDTSKALALSGLIERRVFIIEGPRVISTAPADGELDWDTVRWSADSAFDGGVRVQTKDGEELHGRYDAIGLSHGLEWRVVVLEPVMGEVRAVLTTVAPLMGVLAIGGATALLIAWYVAYWLAAPLRDLERIARGAAAGNYVRTPSTTRGDEIGALFDAMSAVALRLNALQDVSRLMAGAIDLDQVLDAVFSAIRHLTSSDPIAVYLLNDEESAWAPVRTEGEELSGALSVHVAEADWIDQVLASRETVVLIDPPAAVRAALPNLDSGARLVIIPLLRQEERLGVVLIAENPISALGEAELSTLLAFCAQASVAIHTTMLFERENKARGTSETLRSVAERLVRADTLDEALSDVEELVETHFGAAVVRVVVDDPRLLGVADRDEAEGELRTRASEILKSSASEPLVVALSADGPDAAALGDQLGADFLSLIPIGRATGHGATMIIGMSDRMLSGRELQIAHAIAGEIELALENAYLFRRALVRADNLETVLYISQAVSSSLQVNIVLSRVLDVVEKILEADAVALMLYEPQNKVLTTKMGRGGIPAEILGMALAPGEDIAGQVFSRREPVVIHNLNHSKAGIGAFAVSVGLQSLIAVPLLARGHSLGVLMVFSRTDESFNEDDTALLQTFASQAAMAIDTARLYSREHDIARILQSSILPEALPDLPEIEAESIYIPAGEHSEIGGDYYDVFRGPQGSIWVVIGDVCGKGVAAATKTTMIRYIVRALALAGHGPKEILEDANDMVSEREDTSDILTLLVCRYDPASREIRWANGGHPPALLSRVGGAGGRLDTTGPLLGAAPGISYDECSLLLEPGDRIVLFTDGVTEARRGSIFFGEERVRALLEQGKGVPETARAVLSAVRSFAQGELRDDVAILVISPTGETTGEVR